MNETARARISWILVAAIALVTLALAIAFFVNGTFGLGLLVASMVVYAALFASAVALAATERAAEPAASEKDDAEATIVRSDVVYRTRRGNVLRLVVATPEGEVIRFVASDGDVAVGIEDVERAVNASRVGPIPSFGPELEREVDGATERRSLIQREASRAQEAEVKA